jgi:hypothetical protein
MHTSPPEYDPCQLKTAAAHWGCQDHQLLSWRMQHTHRCSLPLLLLLLLWREG